MMMTTTRGYCSVQLLVPGSGLTSCLSCNSRHTPRRIPASLLFWWALSFLSTTWLDFRAKIKIGKISIQCSGCLKKSSFKTRRLGSSDLNLGMVLSYCSLMDVHLNWMMIPWQKKQLFFSNKVMKIASIAEVSKEQMKVLYTQTQLQFSATFLFLGGGKCLTFISHGTILNLTLAVRAKQECAASTFVLTSALKRRRW